MTLRKKYFYVFIALFVFAGVAQADEFGGISVENPWMRFTMASRPAAGYFTLSNKTGKALQLTGASSPACGDIMLHQSKNENGVEKMSMVESVPVPAQGGVTFAPGGYHLMCMNPAKTMKPGATVPVTLGFSGGVRVTAAFTVKGTGGKP